MAFHVPAMTLPPCRSIHADSRSNQPLWLEPIQAGQEEKLVAARLITQVAFDEVGKISEQAVH